MDSFYTMSVSFLPRPLFPILGFPGIFAVTAGGWHKHPLPRSWDNRQRDDVSMRSDAPGRSFLSRSLVYNVWLNMIKLLFNVQLSYIVIYCNTCSWSMRLGHRMCMYVKCVETTGTPNPWDCGLGSIGVNRRVVSACNYSAHMGKSHASTTQTAKKWMETDCDLGGPPAYPTCLDDSGNPTSRQTQTFLGPVAPGCGSLLQARWGIGTKKCPSKFFLWYIQIYPDMICCLYLFTIVVCCGYMINMDTRSWHLPIFFTSWWLVQHGFTHKHPCAGNGHTYK